MSDFFEQAEKILDEFTTQGCLSPNEVKEIDQSNIEYPSLSYFFDISENSFAAMIYHDCRNGMQNVVVSADLAFARIQKEENYVRIFEKCLKLNVQSECIRIFLRENFLVAGFSLAIDSYHTVKTLRDELQRLPHLSKVYFEEIGSIGPIFSLSRQVSSN